MTKKKKILFAFLLGNLFYGCGQSTSINKNKTNTPENTDAHKGRIFQDNPVVVTNNPSFSSLDSFSSVLSREQVYITDKSTLLYDCSPTSTSSKTSCFQVLQDKATTPLSQNSSTWAYPVNSAEFLQVTTFAHTKAITERYLNVLNSLYQFSVKDNFNVGNQYPSSIPLAFFDETAFWHPKTLTTYALCPENGAAYFLSSTFSICLGIDEGLSNFAISQDPTITYHEMGHVFVKAAMNFRNTGSGSFESSVLTDLGTTIYDEAGAINEGISDYFSYVMNERTHLGEWALERYYSASRPMTEANPMHGAGIAETKYQRLSYPHYLQYDPHTPTENDEDVHRAGMITSHYLLALTNLFKTNCSMDHTTATNAVLFSLFETLAELGDLTSKKSDFYSTSEDRVNMTTYSPDGRLVSKEWVDNNNTINYRRFYQVMTRYLLYYFSGNKPLYKCSTLITQDVLEDLLDTYGLLLFKTYNDNGSGLISGHSGTLTQVDLSNRVLSHVIPKDALRSKGPREDIQLFYFDKRFEIASLVKGLQLAGRATNLSPLIPSDFGYNNSNGQPSPGEVVGISLNLYNNSNSDMGQVEILANDWDHGKWIDGEMVPCGTFEDKFPYDSDTYTASTSSSPQVGDCEYITRTGGGESSGSLQETLMPVCMVLAREEDSTRWVSQSAFREDQGFLTDKCLDSSKPESCFVQVLKGGEKATYSRIKGKSTWGETLFQSKTEIIFNANNILFFQISPNTPPGTTFNCRLRARFTNCDECWQDPDLTTRDDYLDFEYVGDRPFKIFNVSFTVID